MLPWEVTLMSAFRGKGARERSGPQRRRAGVSLGAFLVVLCVVSVVGAGAKGWPVDQAGAKMMSYHTLLRAREKFDGKFVWVIGGLQFSNGSAYLGEESGGRESAQKSVCVAPIESVTDPKGSGGEKTLARFDGLSPISVHGRYESAGSSLCPNGTIFAAQLEVSLE
jgi:hypothetical protein